MFKIWDFEPSFILIAISGKSNMRCMMTIKVGHYNDQRILPQKGNTPKMNTRTYIGSPANMRHTLSIFSHLYLTVRCIIVVMVFTTIPVSAVSTAEIDEIRKKPLLSDTDLSQIDTYIVENFNKLMRADTHTVIDETSAAIHSKRASIKVTTKKQYATKYCQTYLKTFKANFSKIATILPEDLGAKTKLTTAFLLAEIDHIDIIDELLNLIKNDDPQIRYWAIHGLSGKNIAVYLHGDGIKKGEEVLNALQKSIATERHTFVIEQISKAAIYPSLTQSSAIQITAINNRIDHYIDWDVTDENIDITLITNIIYLANASNDSDERAQLVITAAKLWSAAFQRFYMGIRHIGTNKRIISLFNQKSAISLISILIDGEKQIRSACNKVNSEVRTSSVFAKMLQAKKLKSTPNTLLTTTLKKSFTSFNGISTSVNSMPKIPKPGADIITQGQIASDRKNGISTPVIH